MAHPNEEVTRRFFEAFNAGDLDTAKEFLAEDMEYHLGGDTPVSGDLKGRDAFLGLRARTGIKGTFELHDVLANDEHAVMLVWTHHEREGKPTFEYPGVFVAHVADGKINEIWSFPFDQAAVKEFLS